MHKNVGLYWGTNWCKFQSQGLSIGESLEESLDFADAWMFNVSHMQHKKSWLYHHWIFHLKSISNVWYVELSCKSDLFVDMILSNIIIASEDVDKLPASVPSPSSPSKSTASPSPEVGVEIFFFLLGTYLFKT